VSRACDDCGAVFEPPAAESAWRKVRCTICKERRAERRAAFDRAAYEGWTLVLSARQAKRLKPYLTAFGALYARWAREWSFTRADYYEAFREAALAPSGRLRRDASERLEAAAQALGLLGCARDHSRTRSSKRASA